ncbi:AAC(3) family N-acetyltransferase [Rathayibacter tritici]|uniref:Aminoglycoside N(3)-acetyltransferase n=2 Tax=Rathayibacter tritici TaxID=33888 RepID=A0A160KTP3_9MICO|nr:AAC(3) family N-acetyltransferase [Rathayibacter tritici]
MDQFDIDPLRPLIIHTSLTAMGLVEGGANALLSMLEDRTRQSALVVPAFSPQLNHPSTWPATRLEGRSIEECAASISFNPWSTPCGRRLGVVPELFRRRSGVARSRHPHTSFAAKGAAAGLVDAHPFALRMGERSPLGRLYDLRANILMIGTSWETCTSLHLAEYRAAYAGRMAGGWLVPLPRTSVEEPTTWRLYDEVVVWEGDFDPIGASFLADHRSAAGCAQTRPVGRTQGTLVDMRSLVDFAEMWLMKYRDLRGWRVPSFWREARPW